MTVSLEQRKSVLLRDQKEFSAQFTVRMYSVNFVAEFRVTSCTEKDSKFHLCLCFRPVHSYPHPSNSKKLTATKRKWENNGQVMQNFNH